MQAFVFRSKLSLGTLAVLNQPVKRKGKIASLVENQAQILEGWGDRQWLPGDKPGIRRLPIEDDYLSLSRADSQAHALTKIVHGID